MVEAGEARSPSYRNCSSQPLRAAGFGGGVQVALTNQTLLCPLIFLVAGGGFQGGEWRGVLYLFLEIATIIIPSTAMATAGATASPVAPDKNSHTANAMQMSPTISLSFLTSSIPPPETQADI